MNALGITLTTHRVPPAIRESMWELYQPFYHYEKTAFMRRFETNTHYALYYRGDKLVGFTGLRILKVETDTKPVLTIYFGQTIIDPGVRGKGLITRTGLLLLRKYWKELVFGSGYFWADSLTYRAYLVFAKNLRDYYPAVHQPLPDEIRSIRDQLGEQYYGQRFCRESGIVRKDDFIINDGSAVIRAAKLADPDIRFFQHANPQHLRGHGLLTIAPINGANLLMMIRKVINKKHRASRRRLHRQLQPLRRQVASFRKRAM